MADININELTREEQDELLLLAARQARATVQPDWPFRDLEDLLTSPEGFALTTATALQRAVCQVIDRGSMADELWAVPEVQLAFGGVRPVGAKPEEVILLAAVRTAKSMLMAANGIHAARICNVAPLSAGEIPRYSIVSLSLDNAKVVLGHLLGAVARPALAPFVVQVKHEAKSDDAWAQLIDETGTAVVGSVFIRHPSGRPVEIRVVAGKRAGGSLVSRWSAGAVFDEAPRMVGASEGVINYDDGYKAVRTRLLEGAQVLSVGSPWQPYGPIYDRVQSGFGDPPQGVVIIKARGPWMNPVYWTEERCEKIRQTDPTLYRTDVLGEFADPEESIFTQALLALSCRKNNEQIGFVLGHDYVAAMDPATRSNSWTLVVADRARSKRLRVVAHAQWTGNPNRPLSPKAVIIEIKDLLAQYQLNWLYSDQWSADAIRDLAVEQGLGFVQDDLVEKEKVDAFASLAVNMALGRVELPDDRQLKKDLLLTKKVPRAGSRGAVGIKLTHTEDGRHCDYAPPLAIISKHWLLTEKAQEPKPGDAEYEKHLEETMVAREVARMKDKQRRPWYDPNDMSEDDDDSLEAGNEGVA